MFKTFGTEESVFINQDNGMFAAFPMTMDEAVLTLETETIGGRKYVKAGSVVKEGAAIRGITAERFDITEGIAQGRVVVEGYAYAHKLTSNALAALTSLTKISTMPYAKTVVALDSILGLVAKLRVFGTHWKSGVAKENITITGTTISAVTIDANDPSILNVTCAAGSGNITAIADAAFVAANGGAAGLPIAITVA